MKRVLGILKPLLVIAVIVGVVRFILSVAHAQRTIVYLASLTAVELVGMVYIAIKFGRDKTLRYPHLWAANLILFGVCQLLYIAGLAYTYLAQTPTLYHETERFIQFMGRDMGPWEHIGYHVLNWMLIAPTLATWVIAIPIAWVMRRVR